ncbi:unnamed protein product [Nesidiocoris tenuis]|uniref:Uncharacterized protein n=1 Tax=Nesidiocoris tenuis TaxID=355587 RepID=A0A6H5H945_9HEMI|nr:unnamed protein product [Nesidiocoris tenuis]
MASISDGIVVHSEMYSCVCQAWKPGEHSSYDKFMGWSMDDGYNQIVPKFAYQNMEVLCVIYTPLVSNRILGLQRLDANIEPRFIFTRREHRVVSDSSTWADVQIHQKISFCSVAKVEILKPRRMLLDAPGFFCSAPATPNEDDLGSVEKIAERLRRSLYVVAIGDRRQFKIIPHDSNSSTRKPDALFYQFEIFIDSVRRKAILHGLNDFFLQGRTVMRQGIVFPAFLHEFPSRAASDVMFLSECFTSRTASRGTFFLAAKSAIRELSLLGRLPGVVSSRLHYNLRSDGSEALGRSANETTHQLSPRCRTLVDSQSENAPCRSSFRSALESKIPNWWLPLTDLSSPARPKLDINHSQRYVKSNGFKEQITIIRAGSKSRSASINVQLFSGDIGVRMYDTYLPFHFREGHFDYFGKSSRQEEPMSVEYTRLHYPWPILPGGQKPGWTKFID